MFNENQFNSVQFDATLTSSSAAPGCPCNSFIETSDGGLTFGGEPIVTDDIVSGGLTFGGTFLVDLLQDPFDGLAAYWQLGQLGGGVSGEYLDSTRNALHGTGGGGSASFTPTQTNGVLCRHSQHFDGTEYISIPSDLLLPTQAFSLSLWVKIESSFKARTWWSRGFDTVTGDKWSVALGHSFIGTPTVFLRKLVDGVVTTTTLQSDIALETDRVHHVGFAYEPGGNLSLYVDGLLGATEIVDTLPILSQTNGGFLGRLNGGSLPEGTMQTVALHPVARDQTWFLTEYQNVCGGLVSQGAETFV